MILQRRRENKLLLRLSWIWRYWQRKYRVHHIISIHCSCGVDFVAFAVTVVCHRRRRRCCARVSLYAIAAAVTRFCLFAIAVFLSFMIVVMLLSS